MIGIYKITNKINNKAYIGQSVDIQRRWTQHKSNIGKNTNPMYLDFKKYGLDNFSFEILEECSIEQLDNLEIYWISKYNTFYDGYNLTEGGKFQGQSSFMTLLFDEWNYKNITSKQWQVYYYLFSLLSNEIIEVLEGQGVLIKISNISFITRELGISRPTFYNALEKLEQEKLIKKDIKRKNYILFPIHSFKINKKLLYQFIKYSNKNSKDIDLLRTYLILKRSKEIYEPDNFPNFSKRNLVTLLGHDTTTSENYDDIDKYLSILKDSKLIYFVEKNFKNKMVGYYTVYSLQIVNQRGEIDGRYL